MKPLVPVQHETVDLCVKPSNGWINAPCRSETNSTLELINHRVRTHAFRGVRLERGSNRVSLDLINHLSVPRYRNGIQMSTDQNSDGDRSTLSTNIYIPVSTDKSALSWDGNDATILGMLARDRQEYYAAAQGPLSDALPEPRGRALKRTTCC